MTPAERATTYAYALVNQAKDFLETAYRVLSVEDGDKILIGELPEIRKAFAEIDEPLNKLTAAFSKEISNITDFKDKATKKKVFDVHFTFLGSTEKLHQVCVCSNKDEAMVACIEAYAHHSSKIAILDVVELKDFQGK